MNIRWEFFGQWDETTILRIKYLKFNLDVANETGNTLCTAQR